MLGLAQNGYLESRAPQFGPDTTIVLMGGGTDKTDSGLVPKRDSMARVAVTATLYKQCRVMLSGGDPQHHGQAEADNYAPYV